MPPAGGLPCASMLAGSDRQAVCASRHPAQNVSESSWYTQGLYRAGGRGPSDSVGDMRLDLTHAFVAVVQQRFIESRVQTARARLKRYLFAQGSHLCTTMGLVTDIYRGLFPVLARFTAAAMPPNVSK